MNIGRKINEKIITKTFKILEPSELKTNVNNIKKSIINAIEIITLFFRFVKSFKTITIKNNAKQVIKRNDLFKIIPFFKF